MKEFSRYTIVSGLALIIDMGTLFVMTEWLGTHYLLSATIGFCFGATVAYLLSINWAFSHRSIEDKRSEFTIFVSIGIAGLGINNALMWSLTELIGFYYMQSKILSTGFVFLFNYTVRRKFLFTQRTPKENA